jgi:hypothetical protein
MPKLKELTPRLRVGRGIKRENLTVFPLLAEASAGQAVEYIPIGRAIGMGVAKITEVSEGGSVPTLVLVNMGAMPILIIDGEELIGARQNRIANLTILAPGMKTLPIPVSCVERGRWSYRSREFTESQDLMYSKVRAQKSRDVSDAMFKLGSHAADQLGVWQHISSMSSRLCTSSATQAMRDVYDNHRTRLEDYTRGVDVIDGQIGAVFAINGIPAGVEMFDSPETLRTYLPKVMRSYSLDAIASHTGSKVRRAEECEAEKLLDSILELETKSFPAIGLGEDLRIDSPILTGGALAQNGRLIHLAAFHTDPVKA